MVLQERVQRGQESLAIILLREIFRRRPPHNPHLFASLLAVSKNVFGR